MSLLPLFLRLFFKLLYHQFAWTYDWVAAIVSVGLWKQWVLAVLPYLPGPFVLELGHGPGHLQSALLDKGIWATGVDASPQMGRLASRRLRRKGHLDRLVQARAQSLPISSGSFDQVIATFPTEYINDAATLNEAWRVLRPGGRVVILPAAWITGQRWMERFAAGLFQITKQAPSFPKTHDSPNSPDYEKAGSFLAYQFPLVDSLEKAGFQVHVEWKELRSSTLIVIQGEKPYF